MPTAFKYSNIAIIPHNESEVTLSESIDPSDTIVLTAGPSGGTNGQNVKVWYWTNGTDHKIKCSIVAPAGGVHVHYRITED